MIWNRASYNGTSGVFPATYDVDSGTVTGGAARCVMHEMLLYRLLDLQFFSPAQGAMFALLALDVKNQTILASGGTAHGNTSSKTNVGAIVGGVVGGVGGAALIVAAAFFWWRRRRARTSEVVYEKASVQESRIISPEAFPYNSTANEPAAPTTTDQTQSADTSEQQQPPAVPLMSTKLREHLRQLQPQTPSGTGSASTSSGAQTQTSGSRYSVDPPTTVGTSPSARSELHGLRTEVENLRRYMEELHAHPMEAPPSYAEEPE